MGSGMLYNIVQMALCNTLRLWERQLQVRRVALSLDARPNEAVPVGWQMAQLCPDHSDEERRK